LTLPSIPPLSNAADRVPFGAGIVMAAGGAVTNPRVGYMVVRRGRL
jgi:hypothetical protein